MFRGGSRPKYVGTADPSLSFSFPSLFPFFPSLLLEVGPLNTTRGPGKRCKLPQRGLGQSRST